MGALPLCIARLYIFIVRGEKWSASGGGREGVSQNELLFHFHLLQIAALKYC